MRVNMDESVATGVRFKVVARSLGVPTTQIFGACFLVWLECYNRRSVRLASAEANACADLGGFADAMVEAGLATDEGDGVIRFHGVEERIRFLQKQAERGAKGGKSKGNRPQANAKRTLSTPTSERQRSAQANTLTLTQAPTHTQDQSSSAPPSGSHVAEKQDDKGKKTSKSKQPSTEAHTLADCLRRRMLGAKPDHRIGRGANSESRWPLSAQRRKWAQSADRMNRIDGRDWRRSSELVAWVYGPQNLEGECSYVVESMDALREKWDRLDAAARRGQRREEEQPMIVRRGYGE